MCSCIGELFKLVYWWGWCIGDDVYWGMNLFITMYLCVGLLTYSCRVYWWCRRLLVLCVGAYGGLVCWWVCVCVGALMCLCVGWGGGLAHRYVDALVFGCRCVLSVLGCIRALVYCIGVVVCR